MVYFVEIIDFQSKKSEMIIDEMTKLYESARPVCISETGIDETKVKSLEAAHPVDDKNIFCFAGCIMKYMDIVSFVSPNIVQLN